MEIEALKRIIRDQRNEITQKLREERIIEREHLSYVKKFLRHPNIVAVLGVRRAGKSVFAALLSSMLSEDAAYIDFDDERLIAAKTEDLDKVLQAFYELYGKVKLIVLDEIQNVQGWELFATRLRRTKRVIVTGSNSKLLSGELATHLTGRHVDFTLYPFAFREMLSFRPDVYLTEDIAKVRNELEKYIKGSGFPEFEKFGPDIVRAIYTDIISKDCIRKHRIRGEESFRELANYLITNFAGEFTYSKLSRILGIKDVHTVKNYVSYLKEAFLVIVLDRFSPKLKQQIIAPKKAYAIDHGFCNFLSFRLSDDLGKILENTVCVELLRRKSTDYNMEIYYWKNPQQFEVDFVVKQGQKVAQLIQVCYDIGDYDTKKRETKALLKASLELKCSNLLIITYDKEGQEKIKGKTIRYIPLWKWLLQ